MRKQKIGFRSEYQEPIQLIEHPDNKVSRLRRKLFWLEHSKGSSIEHLRHIQEASILKSAPKQQKQQMKTPLFRQLSLPKIQQKDRDLKSQHLDEGSKQRSEQEKNIRDKNKKLINEESLEEKIKKKYLQRCWNQIDEFQLCIKHVYKLPRIKKTHDPPLKSYHDSNIPASLLAVLPPIASS